MLRPRGRVRRGFSLLVVVPLVGAWSVASAPPPVVALSPDVVISQVYGGGGNSGGDYTNDYVELFNRGTATVSLDGWSVQYASAAGTGNFGRDEPDHACSAGRWRPASTCVQEAGGITVSRRCRPRTSPTRRR